MYRKTILPNGLRIVTETMPAVRSATLGIWADVGSAAESGEQRGISHLVEHMLFKGTTRRSARQIAETMDGVGGNLNAFTDKESTCYYAKVIDRHVPLAMDVLADMFLHSTFDPGELAKEQKVVLEEIKMYDDSPTSPSTTISSKRCGAARTWALPPSALPKPSRASRPTTCARTWPPGTRPTPS